jgi:hypothetical protein
MINDGESLTLRHLLTIYSCDSVTSRAALALLANHDAASSRPTPAIANKSAGWRDAVESARRTRFSDSEPPKN